MRLVSDRLAAPAQHHRSMQVLPTVCSDIGVVRGKASNTEDIPFRVLLWTLEMRLNLILLKHIEVVLFFGRVYVQIQILLETGESRFTGFPCFAVGLAWSPGVPSVHRWGIVSCLSTPQYQSSTSSPALPARRSTTATFCPLWLSAHGTRHYFVFRSSMQLKHPDQEARADRSAPRLRRALTAHYVSCCSPRPPLLQLVQHLCRLFLPLTSALHIKCNRHWPRKFRPADIVMHITTLPCGVSSNSPSETLHEQHDLVKLRLSFSSHSRSLLVY
jgi:hypothetical protein